MLGRGGSVALGPLGNMVESGGSAPGFGRLGKDGNGGEEKGIEGIAVGIVGTKEMLGRGGSVALGPLGNMVGSGGSAPGFGRLGKDGNGGKEKGIEGIAVGIVGIKGMLGRGGSMAFGPLGNMVGSGGSAPGFGRLGKDGNGGENKLAIEGIAVGILGTEGMLGRGGSVAFDPLENMVGSGGSAPSFGNEGMDGSGNDGLGKDGNGGNVFLNKLGV
ncbi:hypothetical protein Goshw_026929 [Gossypium schwendimanii]|uniref:Uncharacterized protein n=1 Tax=Gossypium schwendimanii TaxID=34291 RepID=A0A7J9MVK0_GOSSC|nr:hypothetical protein [Gossypium schwendimanii]